MLNYFLFFLRIRDRKTLEKNQKSLISNDIFTTDQYFIYSSLCHLICNIYLEEYLVMIAQLFQNLFKVVIAYALEKLYRYCAIVERGKQIS